MQMQRVLLSQPKRLLDAIDLQHVGATGLVREWSGALEQALVTQVTQELVMRGDNLRIEVRTAHR